MTFEPAIKDLCCKVRMLEWNELDEDVQKSEDMATFKKKAFSQAPGTRVAILDDTEESV